MRIAQIAPLAESVPPKLYGGTERVVSWLADELVALGHEVTLFASGDSRTKAKLVPAWPRALRLGRPRSDPAPAYAALLEAVAEVADDFDVIHSHVDWLHLPLLRRLRTPFLTTLHGRLDLLAMQCFDDAPFVSISQSQRARCSPDPHASIATLSFVHYPTDSPQTKSSLSRAPDRCRELQVTERTLFQRRCAVARPAICDLSAILPGDRNIRSRAGLMQTRGFSSADERLLVRNSTTERGR